MSMNRLVWAGAALASAWVATPVAAADLNGPMSIKDGPVYARAAGPCYFRADAGYSWSTDPHATYTQTDGGGVFLTNEVAGADLDDTWLVGAGFGCGSGPRGIRGEVMFDWRGDRDFTGFFVPTVTLPLGADARTSIQTSTIMFNAYYDLGHWGSFVPYIGAGVGLAHNDMGGLTDTSAPGVVQSGNDKWSLAWSLMAGGGFQLSDRVILDVGYRFIDMGKAESGTIDSLGAPNPPLRVNELYAHEFKVGLRFHFGG
jgi:opacity protein-like surface antigen